jgi:aminoglycoside N3'-acetyltransferase
MLRRFESADKNFHTGSIPSKVNIDQLVVRAPTVAAEKPSLSPRDFISAIEASTKLVAVVKRFKTMLISSLKTEAFDPKNTINSTVNRVVDLATETSVPANPRHW